MKSLDLKQIGLQELTTVETRSVDGGCGGLCVLGVALLISLINNAEDAIDGAIDGWNAADGVLP